jgi:hypothetical protein
MKRRPSSVGYGAYPTNELGFAVPIEETRVPYIESEKIEIHHFDFYKAMFARLAISQTFRDLQSQQTPITSPSHIRLHQMYQGIQLPPIANMLDYIEHQQYTGGKLNIREPYVGYVQHDITDERMDALYDEYNRIHHHL